MKWNLEEIAKELVDNCSDRALVAIAFMNPKSFDKLFNEENEWDMKFIAEGKKRVIVYKNEAVAENYIIAGEVNPDYNDCIAIGADNIIFPQTGEFTIPLIPEDE